MSDLTGQIINNRFRVLSLIGRGGITHVYRALDNRLCRDVAIKFFDINRINQDHLDWYDRKPGFSGCLVKFIGDRYRSLYHPNILRLYDVGTINKIPFLIMDFADGVTLNELIYKNGLFPIKYAAQIILPVAKALEYVHQRAIIHGFVKPREIFVLRNEKVLLYGFENLVANGCAELIHMNNRYPFFLGHPSPLEKMIIEQGFRDPLEADTYALILVFIELVTGLGPDVLASISAHPDQLERVIRNLKEKLAKKQRLHPQIEKLILNLILRKRTERIITMRELIGIFEMLLSTPDISEV